MRGMHQAPTRIHRRVGQQPLRRALIGPGKAGVHFALLFGDMDVDRSVGERHQRRQLLRGDRAQAVWRQPKHRVWQRFQAVPAVVQQAREAVDIVDQTTLRRVRGGTTEIRMRIEHRQQAEPDAGIGGRGGNALGHFAGMRVRRAADGVVQVMEFTDAREAAFEHFHIGLFGNHLQAVRVQLVNEAVHQLAPAPEAVAAAPANLGQPRHAALEGVAMHVAQARQQHLAARVGHGSRRIGLHRGNAALRY